MTHDQRSVLLWGGRYAMIFELTRHFFQDAPMSLKLVRQWGCGSWAHVCVQGFFFVLASFFKLQDSLELERTCS